MTQTLTPTTYISSDWGWQGVSLPAALLAEDPAYAFTDTNNAVFVVGMSPGDYPQTPTVIVKGTWAHDPVTVDVGEHVQLEVKLFANGALVDTQTVDLISSPFTATFNVPEISYTFLSCSITSRNFFPLSLIPGPGTGILSINRLWMELPDRKIGTYEELHNLLRSNVDGQLSKPIVFDNAPNTQTGEYVRIKIDVDDDEQFDLDGGHLISGDIVCEVFTSINLGTQAVLALIDEITYLFRSLTLSGYRFSLMRFADQGRDGGYWKYTYKIGFRRNAFT